MRDNIPIDPETGLPKFPEGYFIRVTRRQDIYSDIFPWVSLMHRRKSRVFPWHYTREIQSMYNASETMTSEEKIDSISRSLYFDLMKERSKAHRIQTDEERLSGDYPPRRLNADPKNRSR